MKILITTFGTRGDLQPYVAFALGLQEAGHLVAICTSEGYRSFVEGYGLQYEYLDRELLELTQLLMGEAETMRDIIGATRKMPPLMRQMMEEEWNTAHRFEPDLIIYHPKCLGSFHVAEKLKIPAILSLPLPSIPQRRHSRFLSGRMPVWESSLIGGAMDLWKRHQFSCMAG